MENKNIEQEFPELAPLLGKLTANADRLREMTQLARSGKKLEAIKIYREITGVGLQEAKDAIERLQATGQLDISQATTTVAQPQMTGLSGAQVEEIAQLLHSKNKIEAIKRYRLITNAGLKEAKDAVEWIEKLPGFAQSGYPGSIPQAPVPTIEKAPFPPADIGIGDAKPRSGGASTFGIIVAVILLVLLVGGGVLAFMLLAGH